MLLTYRKTSMSVHFTPAVTFVLLLSCRTFYSSFAVENDIRNSTLGGVLLRKLNTSVSDITSNNTNKLSLDKNSSVLSAQNDLNQRQLSKTSDDLFSTPSGDTSKMSDEELVNHEIRDINKHSNSESNLETTILSQLTKLFRERAKQFKHRMQTFLTSELDLQESHSTNSSPGQRSTEIASAQVPDSAKIDLLDDDQKSPRKKTARQFPFVFHPYLPYGKEVMPDEKLSIHDVLPVKMVKFIKSMVEDAPWEAMFMKMVRMVVDQFVDKIMEKMFAGKDEEDKWRSVDDGPFELNPSPLPIPTFIKRMRRSAEILKASKDGQTGNGLNHFKKDAEGPEEDSWLDLFLDYVFPGEEKEDEKANDKRKTRRKREAPTKDPEDLVHSSPLLNMDLFDGMQNFVLTLKVRQALKDFIRYRILKRVLRPLTSWREVTDTKRIDVTELPTYLMSSHRNQHGDIGKDRAVHLARPKRSTWREVIDTKRIDVTAHPTYLMSSHRYQNGKGRSTDEHRAVHLTRPKRSTWREVTDTKRIDVTAHPTYLMSSHRNQHGKGRSTDEHRAVHLARPKRSTRGNSRRIDDETNDLYQGNQKLRDPTHQKKEAHSERLWQSNHGIRSSHYKRDDCSLRRACNAGRLLARFPSVEDITLQLKSRHHEPHWDALLWGLKKKRCSRIFCKRQRSPKGSKNFWNPSDQRQNRKAHPITPPSFESYSKDDDATTVIPF